MLWGVGLMGDRFVEVLLDYIGGVVAIYSHA